MRLDAGAPLGWQQIGSTATLQSRGRVRAACVVGDCEAILVVSTLTPGASILSLLTFADGGGTEEVVGWGVSR